MEDGGERWEWDDGESGRWEDGKMERMERMESGGE